MINRQEALALAAKRVSIAYPLGCLRVYLSEPMEPDWLGGIVDYFRREFHVIMASNTTSPLHGKR